MTNVIDARALEAALDEAFASHNEFISENVKRQKSENSLPQRTGATNVIEDFSQISQPEISSRETQNVTNGIVGEGIEKKEGFHSLSHPYNPVCHVHSREWKPPRKPLVEAAEDFDPEAAARALLPIAHYRAWTAFDAIIPRRMRDGSKLPPGRWREMKEALVAAHKALRHDHYPHFYRNRDA